MKRTIQQLSILLFIIPFFGCQSSKVNVEKVNKENPKKVAIAVLKSYQQKNIENLHALATQQNAITLQKMMISERLVKERRIFTSEPFYTIEKWDGKIREVRFSDNLQTAYAMFDGNLEGDAFGEVHVVTLQLEDKKWRFDNIAAYTKQSFDALGYVME